jgi:acetyl esterase/lipase
MSQLRNFSFSRKWRFGWGSLLLLVMTILFFQNCSKSGFSPLNSAQSPNPNPSSAGVSCHLASAPAVAGQQYVAHKDIVYNPTYTVKSGGQTKALDRLDLSMPNGISNPPLVVLIHGGGWDSGNKEVYEGFPNGTNQPYAPANDLMGFFVADGYAVASLDYRLLDAKTGTNAFPAALQDVRCAIRFLRSQASTYGYNPNAIGVFGGSAGGNLAAFLGTAASVHSALLDDPNCPVATSVSVGVQVVADYYGVNNAADPAAFNADLTTTFTNYIGQPPAAPAPNPSPSPYFPFGAAWNLAAPQTYITSGAATLPPFIVVHGTADVRVPELQSKDFLAALQAVNAPAQFFEVAGAPHYFSPFQPPSSAFDATQSTCAMLNLFSQSLKSGSNQAPPANVTDYDVVVYRATPAGIMAAVEAGTYGLRVLLVEDSSHIGGMMGSGLGLSDVGISETLTGQVGIFYDTVCSIYESLPTPIPCDYHPAIGVGAPPYDFEPHIAVQAFQQMLANAHVTVQLDAGTPDTPGITSVQKNGAKIQSITLGTGAVVTASEFVDGSYEGDLLALAGVTTTIGREANSQYKETGNGWGPIEYQKSMYNTQLLVINPFVNGSSGALIPFVAPALQTIPAQGSADSLVMAYTYRLCLQGSQNPGNQTPFVQPPGYSDAQYEIFHRYLVALQATQPVPTPSSSPASLVSGVLHFGAIPNNKYDINNSSMFSTDFIGHSSAYATATAAERRSIEQNHQNYEQGLLYYLANGSTSPASVKAEMANYGLCKDEFTDTANWPHQIYVREARRMVSDYVVTEQDVFRLNTGTQQPYNTPLPVALGSYALDTHAVERFAYQTTVNGSPTWLVATEAGSLQTVPNPYPISFSALVPKSNEASNLLTTNTLSASHSAYRSIRMEPNYMMIGHAAGAAAALAVIYGNTSIQNLDYPSIQARLSADGMLTDFPGISSVVDEGPTSSGTGRVIRLNGTFPPPASAYSFTTDFVKYAASCEVCTAPGPQQTCQSLKPVGQSLSYVSYNEIDLNIALPPASYGECVFQLNNQDPNVGHLHTKTYPTNSNDLLQLSPDK